MSARPAVFSEQLPLQVHTAPFPEDHLVMSVPLTELLTPDGAARFLSVYAQGIRADRLQPAAAFFCAYAGDLAVAQQYMLSVGNRVIDVSLPNLTIQIYQDHERHRLSFGLQRWSERPLPTTGPGRTLQRSRALSDVYSRTLAPVFHAISAAAHMHLGQLWGQLPARLLYFKGVMLSLARTEPVRDRILEDWNALHDLDPGVFGLRKNPFCVRPRLVEDMADPQKRVPIKSACCL
jgi:hypothetical protein